MFQIFVYQSRKHDKKTHQKQHAQKHEKWLHVTVDFLCVDICSSCKARCAQLACEIPRYRNDVIVMWVPVRTYLWAFVIPRFSVKPVLNWAKYLFAENTSDNSTNYDSFLNWTFSSPNVIRTVRRSILRLQIWFSFFIKPQLCAFRKELKKDTKLRITTKSQPIKKFPPMRVKYLATPSSIFFPFFSHPQESSLLSASLRHGSLNRVNIPRICWAKLFGPRL